MERFDYVIVGGGSAGCVLAGRLTEDPKITVCLIETGGRDQSQVVQCPIGTVAMLPTKLNNWAFETVPQLGLNGRRGYQPRGKVLGGSSSINAMIYIRGHRADYDQWAALGNAGWSYDDILPFFRKAERNEQFIDQFHGGNGPLNVAANRTGSRFPDIFIKAATECGYKRTPDFNGEDQEGVGLYQLTQKNGERFSAAKGYLTPNLSRPNLTVLTKALATKIRFEGKRAVGVDITVDGTAKSLTANQEVIVSAGAFGSPQLLQLSGIGDAESLKKLGIAVLHHLPGVGQNLQDHIDYVFGVTSKATDLFGVSLGGLPGLVKGFMNYRSKGTGPLTSNFAEAGGFIKSEPSEPIPDLQWHFVTAIVDDHARKFHLSHGYSLHVCLLRPKSRGSVLIKSNNPKDAPLIDPNFYGERDDVDRMIKGFKLTRAVLDSAAFKPFKVKELYTANIKTDAEIEQSIRDKSDTVYHPVGTCKMGSSDDPLAVVDATLKVHGLDGLRVIDASIMPTLVGGNTNAPTIMIAERAVDFVRTAQRG